MTKLAKQNNGRNIGNGANRIKTAVGDNDPQKLVIPGMQLMRVNVSIVGTTPLIMHRCVAKVGDKTPQPKNAKPDIRAIAAEACHLMPDSPPPFEKDCRYAIPENSIKHGLVNSSAYWRKNEKSFVKGALFVTGGESGMLELKAAHPRIREDVVTAKNAGNSKVMCYRPEFFPWELSFIVEYSTTTKVTEELIFYLVQLMGFHNGIGCMRGEKGYSFGRFKIKGT